MRNVPKNPITMIRVSFPADVFECDDFYISHDACASHTHRTLCDEVISALTSFVCPHPTSLLNWSYSRSSSIVAVSSFPSFSSSCHCRPSYVYVSCACGCCLPLPQWPCSVSDRCGASVRHRNRPSGASAPLGRGASRLRRVNALVYRGSAFPAVWRPGWRIASGPFCLASLLSWLA